MAAPEAEADPSMVRRAVTASAIGNATEWFDYGVYAYVATEIGANFFPGEYETLAALMVFAVSFLLRPLGGIVWGTVGDRLGRQRTLVLTIFLIAASTFLIGVLPTYASIGVLAPVLLVVLRMVQGFSAGGEYGGAATFMAEYAPDRRRGFFGSFLEVGTIAGFTLALVVAGLTEAAIGPEAMTAWGWRVPFLVAAPLGLAGFLLRRKLEDTPVFRELAQQGEVEERTTSHLRDLVATYWRPLLTLAGLVVALNVANYTLITYIPTYLQETVGMDPGDADLLITIGQLAMLVLLPVAGAVSDRVGRKPMWWFSLVGMFVLAVPMYLLMAQGFWWALVGFAVLGLLYVPQLGTVSAMFPAMFPAHVRFLGFGAAYNVSTALFGGTAPPINEALIGATGSSLVPAFYMMAAFVVGMIALVFVPETVGCSIRGRTVPRREPVAAPRGPGEVSPA